MLHIQDPRIQSRWTEAGGVRVHYQHRRGSGPVLVLLPGGMLDSSALTWKSLMEALPARYRVLSPDLPGYGDSAAPDLPYTTAYYVRFVEDFLDAVEVPRAALLASSMSGAVALGFARRSPERVQALVLSGAYGLQPRAPLHEAAYLLSRVPGIFAVTRHLLRTHPLAVRAALPLAVRDARRITGELVADAYAGLQHPHALRAFGRWMRHELRPRRLRTCLAGRVHRLRMPALFLHGEKDWMLPSRHIRAAARVMPHAEAHVLPGCGHLVPRERPETTNRLAFSFLRRCEREGVFTGADRNPPAGRK